MSGPKVMPWKSLVLDRQEHQRGLRGRKGRRVLIVGELPHSQRVELADRGAQLTICDDVEPAMVTLAEQDFDVVVVDLATCGSALRLVSLLKHNSGDFLRVRLDGPRWRESAEFAELARLATKELDLTDQQRPRRVDARPNAGLEGLIGSGAAMRELFDAVKRVAPTNGTVLIGGAPGTGHKALARAIHHDSHRRTRRFEVVDCRRLPNVNPELELRRAVAQAEGGTLVLDHVERLPPGLQEKVRRVLETDTTGPLGGASSQVNVRLLATTSVDLWQQMQSGGFSEALYFLLSVFTLSLPSLRERREDIVPIAQQVRRLLGGDQLALGDELALLARQDWPGNVRELVHVVRRIVDEGHAKVAKVDAFNASVQGAPPPTSVELEDALFRAFHARNLNWSIPRETIERAAARHVMTPFIVAPPDTGTPYAIIISAPELSFIKSPEQLPLTSAVMTIDAAAYLGTAKPTA